MRCRPSPPISAAITATTTLTSTLTVTAAGDATYTAEHALDTAEFAVERDDVEDATIWSRFGEPVIDVKDVPFSDDGTSVTIGAHGFTLGWPTLWLQAFTDLSLDVRVAGLGSPAIPCAGRRRSCAPAAHGGKSGCAAVDDLVCSVTTGSGSCALDDAVRERARPDGGAAGGADSRRRRASI